MLNQQKAWLMALGAMMRRATDLDGDEPWPKSLGSLEMETIEGMAGRLRPGERRAANDLEAALFILLLIWVWNYANYRAKLAVLSSVSRKLTRGEILVAIPPHPAWLRLFPDLIARFALCHNDHLPTK